VSRVSKRHSAATKLIAEPPAWHFFGGKGGVGKTTCAAAWALAHAEHGANVLVVSTDPAHSLADAFTRSIGSTAKRIPTRRGRLEALEINSARVVARWIKRHRAALATLIERGTLLDREDVREMLALPVPGLDELAAFLQLGAFQTGGAYDLVVVDTAPTGHTLRLLETPDLIDQLGRALEAMDNRDAAIRAAFTRGRQADRPASLVAELHAQARMVSGLLRDPGRCEVRWVTLAEPVTVAETIDGIEWLRERSVALKGVVVNRVTPTPRGRCAECNVRRALEADALSPLTNVARALELRVVPDQPREPRGPSALREISGSLLSAASWQFFHRQRRLSRSGRSMAATNVARANRVPAKLVAATLNRGVVFFGGKGGVGKTTCAAAVALHAAREGRTVRLISVDPAPSLGDVLGTRIGDEWRTVAPRVIARELEARRVLEEYKSKYRQAVGDMFDRLLGGSVFDAAADRAVFEQLFDLAPAGVDEIVALLTVTSLATEGHEDGAELVIVDAAPTGHMLRFLAMPADVQRWVALLMRLVVKYQLASRAESIASNLVTLSRELRALSIMLRDPRRARVIAVTRAAALPRLETVRLLKELRRLKIAAPTLIVNAESVGTCARCRARRRVETSEIRRLRALCAPAKCTIIHAPLASPPPHGRRALLAWAAEWTR
jgi:arsenite-transporting ATPase